MKEFSSIGYAKCCHGEGVPRMSTNTMATATNGLMCSTRCVSFSNHDTHASLKPLNNRPYQQLHDPDTMVFKNGATHFGYKNNELYNVFDERIIMSNKCSTKLTSAEPQERKFAEDSKRTATYVHIVQPKESNYIIQEKKSIQLNNIESFGNHSKIDGQSLSVPRDSLVNRHACDQVMAPRADVFNKDMRAVACHYPQHVDPSNDQIMAVYEFYGGENVFVDDEVYDISDINFDFMTLTGNDIYGESAENTPMSIVDMIYGVPDMPPKTMVSSDDSLVISVPMEISPEPIEAPLYKQVRERYPSKKHSSPKKTKQSRANRDTAVSVQGTVVAPKPKQENADVSLGDAESIVWYPGFNRQLGAKGRSALLDLVRRVYRQDPPYYRAILQARNPPSSISNLPFFNIPMLWELTHQFGVFDQALLIHKNQVSSTTKPERVKSKSKNEKTEAVVPANEPAPVHSEKVVEPLFDGAIVEKVVPIENSSSQLLNETLNHSDEIEHHDVNVEIGVFTPSVQQNVEIKAIKQKSKTENVILEEPVKQTFTSFSGRSIKPNKRYVDYQDEYGRSAKRLTAYQEYTQETKEDPPAKCISITASQDYSKAIHECASPALSHSTAVSLNDTDEVLVDQTVNNGDMGPSSLVWCVTQQFVKRGLDVEREVIGDSMSPVSSSRNTPTRCISV
ncbi:uncharacterized protein BXIN_0543 [Babesia sp. Xinjiang]|uniref:uncharacterized protein n=1 Tax=Babesia sp. Xinjiang TaxID=462227 RepID=UPI000A2377C9|nr:uncharacterized protein BXIN_0543 [Babesia sp. Xinjiang]ORM41951.1 hypothetical protein BXIN_0543 [Babesia sp. Xinjiang]